MPSGSKKATAARNETPADNRPNADAEKTIAAHDEALHDIEQDADLSIHSPNDDLDEGETARLGEDKTDIV